MRVLYYANTHFLDATLDLIRSFNHSVELHVVIEISPMSSKTTIINVENLADFNELEPAEKVLGKDKWELIKPYFNGATTVQFVVHKNNRSFALSSIKSAYVLGKFIKKINAEIIHFDTLTLRSFGMVPFLKGRKIFITMHDPVNHTGEERELKEKIYFKFFFSIADGFFFYSQFSNRQFKETFPDVKGSRSVIRFQPFTYINQFYQREQAVGQTILFFGRLSYYKGIDLLLQAIPKVLSKYPDEVFVIAGKSYGYNIDQEIVNRYPDNIKVISRFITVPELLQFISKAKFVVCPYREATQSGVLMTAYSIGKMVVATRVGAFPEYIEESVTGLLADPDPDAIAAKIIEALEQNKYLKMEQKVVSTYSKEIAEQNMNILFKSYSTVKKQVLNVKKNIVY